MPTCERCNDLLLDYVYALLEDSELQEMREHLSTCPTCQTALIAAQAEQKLLAHAARAISDVPEFTLPKSQPAEVSPNAATVPLLVVNAPKRSTWRRPWIAWSAAAAVLLTVGTSVAAYRYELNARHEALANARQQLRSVDVQLASFPAQCEGELKDTLQTLRTQTGPYLHVVGPTTLPPHGKASVRITTRDIEGDLLASTIRLKLVEPETGNVLFLSRFDSEGQKRGDIDTSNAKANTTLNLVIEADTAHGVARVQESVRVAAPSFVTRLDVNKTVYQPKDVLFFRALVLDRYSLTPPGQRIAMRAELKAPAGSTAAYIDLESGAGGILAGELPIDEQFPAGRYTLHVTPLKAPEVQAAVQSLDVVRELPGIRLDQDRYAQGGVLTGEVKLPHALANDAKAKGKIGNNKAVDVKLQALAAGAAPAGGAAGGGLGSPSKAKGAKLSEEGHVFRFQMRLPENLPADQSEVPLTLEVHNGTTMTRRQVNVPIESTEFAIDFFPEGGDLIEGVKSRVFYRVRFKTGEPVTGDGRVVLLTGKNTVVDTHYKLGLGHLDFTPDSKETYAVRLTTPMKLAEIANPFANPGIRKNGIVLHVPRAVGKEGDAIRLVLRHKSPARKLVLLAHCRGQIVAERTVELKAGSNEVTLQPTADAHGMIRVTAYEVVGNQLHPVAERLVYRAPAQRLDLGFTLNTQKLLPGLQNLKAKVRSNDEKGQPAPAWMLASIVDERFQPKSPSLSAHFLLLNEVRSGADIDNAQLILNDSAESTQVLERFLGTHGWRRFVPVEEPPLMALAKADGQRLPLLFSRENMPLAEMQEKHLAQRTAALRPIHDVSLQKEADLNNEREIWSKAVALAQQGAFDFEYEVKLVIRLALGLVLALLLLASLALMAIGVYRLARAHHRLATPAFGAAFGSLAACLAVMFIGYSMGAPERTMVVSSERTPRASEVNKMLERTLAAAPKPRIDGERPMNGLIALATPAKSADPAPRLADADGKRDAMGFGGPPIRFADNSAKALTAMALRERQEVGALAALPDNPLRNTDRFEQARKLATMPTPLAVRGAAEGEKVKPAAAPPAAMPLAPAPAGSATMRKKVAADTARRVEYFHEHVPNMRADTLLWHPTLWLEHGSAEVHFDIASGQATYRVLLLAHSPSGRFGFFETRLHVPGP